MTRRNRSRLSPAARHELLRLAAGGPPRRLVDTVEWQLRDAGYLAGFTGSGPSLTAAGHTAAAAINQRKIS